MERRRPEVVAMLPVRHLNVPERVWRSVKRSGVFMGIVLLVGNVSVIFLPIPHVHLCIFPIAFVIGPLIALFSWRDRVLLPQTDLPCPRCAQNVTIPEGLGGWPARFNCDACAAMVELNAA